MVVTSLVVFTGGGLELLWAFELRLAFLLGDEVVQRGTL
jgi:hypothetical protein